MSRLGFNEALVEEIRAEAQKIYAGLGPGETLPMDDVIRLLRLMEMGERVKARTRISPCNAPDGS